MNRLSVFFMMMTLVIAVVVYILYHVFRTPDRIVIYRENPPAMESSPAWGYRARGWWRRYEGVPGMGKETPHPPTVTPPQPGKYVPAFHVQTQ
jgi:hypothetical protein